MRLSLILTLALATTIVAYKSSSAQTYSVLYNFGAAPGDGIAPVGTLIEDNSGKLYGTTQVGGAHSFGAIFELNSAGIETVLYSFAGPPDAAFPGFGVVRDTAGNLYGVSNEGGVFGMKNRDGAAFKLSASQVETVIHSFGNKTDGIGPSGPLIRDAQGNLYGTTALGGQFGAGTVFKISPTGRETVLHSFTGQDGATPFGGLIRDGQGNLYGTTATGGENGMGTVFEVASDGSENVLYSFCSSLSCTDGSEPEAGLVQDSQGNLYGTTLQGGTYDEGTVFRVSKSGGESVLYSFNFGSSGYIPWSGLVRDAAGNLYGTTFAGGANGYGTVFTLDRTGKESVLYSFCSMQDCADGSSPAFSPLLRDNSGNLYGIAGGGSFQSGVVFKVTP